MVGFHTEHEAQAFEDAFRAHYSALCRYASRHVRSDPEGEDLVQDVFLRLWERRERLHGALNLRAYLYSAVRNRALDHLKHRRVVARFATSDLLSASPPPTPDRELCLAELAGAAERAVAELPARCREAFTLSRRDGLSYREIAEALDVSVKTVETQIRRATRSIRCRLEPHLE